MNKICVIAGQSGYEIVKEFHKKNIEILLVCGQDKESGHDITDELFVCDLKNIENILEKIRSYSNYLFLGTGHNLAIKIAKLYKKEGGIINFSTDIASLFKNKLKTHQYIQSLGYKTPIIYIIEYMDDHFTPNSFPVILKSEEDSYKTEMVSNINDFHRVKRNILNSGSKVIVEKFIDGFEVTIPVKSMKNQVIARKESLNMKEINKKAVSILKGFDMDREEKNNYNASNFLSDELKERVVFLVEDIIEKSGFIGYPRFDIMIDINEEIYILEINSIMVTALGGLHYPWLEVGINPAKDMVELYLNSIKPLNNV